MAVELYLWSKRPFCEVKKEKKEEEKRWIDFALNKTDTV